MVPVDHCWWWCLTAHRGNAFLKTSLVTSPPLPFPALKPCYRYAVSSYLDTNQHPLPGQAKQVGNGSTMVVLEFCLLRFWPFMVQNANMNRKSFLLASRNNLLCFPWTALSTLAVQTYPWRDERFGWKEILLFKGCSPVYTRHFCWC